MLRLFSFKAQGCKDFWKPSKPSHVGIHWITCWVLSVEYPCQGFSNFSSFLHHFVLANLANIFKLCFCLQDFIRIFRRLWLLWRLKKKLFVSCNPTLTSFIQKNTYPKVFLPLPTPNQCKTCIKLTFLTKKKTKKKRRFYWPTYPISFLTVTGNKQFIFLGLSIYG